MIRYFTILNHIRPDNYIIIPGENGICNNLKPKDMGVLLDGNGQKKLEK